MRCILRLIFFAELILSPATSLAQTTQPATDAAWVQQFAASLVHESEIPPASVVFSRFEKEQASTFDDLRAAVSDRRLMFCQSYNGVPQTLGSDVATALRDGSAADSIKRLFIPRTSDGLKHADEVAASWVQSVLKPAAADAVGVLLFCADPSSDRDHPSDLVIKPAPPLIVLIDAGPLSANGNTPRIRRVLFGDPRPR